LGLGPFQALILPGFSSFRLLLVLAFESKLLLGVHLFESCFEVVLVLLATKRGGGKCPWKASPDND